MVPPLSKCTYIVVCLHHIEGTYDWSAQLPVNYSKVLTTGQLSYLCTRRYLRLVSPVTCELLEGTYDWSAQLPVNYSKVLSTGQLSYLCTRRYLRLVSPVTCELLQLHLYNGARLRHSCNG